jgi:hypothetical protein
MTDQTGIGRPTTYHAASAAYSYTGDARARHDELAQREQLARAYATLKTRGEYDPGKHGSGDTEALTLAGCLEILATGEVVARTCRHPVDVDRALAAGCGLGSGGGRARLPRGHARQDYRESAADFGTSARPRPAWPVRQNPASPAPDGPQGRRTAIPHPTTTWGKPPEGNARSGHAANAQVKEQAKSLFENSRL